MSVSIEKVRIKMGSKVVELSLKEAQDLKALLNETFPDYVAPIVIEREVIRPLPYPARPWTLCETQLLSNNSWSAEAKDNVATYSLTG